MFSYIRVIVIDICIVFSCVCSESYDKMLLEKTVVSGGTSPSHSAKLDPLASLAKQLGGSKRNALLRWCQNKTASYPVN